jgi:hypothetical protein
MTPTQGDALFSDLRLVSLEKQLNIELKVMHIELIFLFKIPPAEGMYCLVSSTAASPQ